jgi:PPK2 family polyphosphate:nucleotide phosphotransferase
MDPAKGKHTLLRSTFRVEPGSKVQLDRFDPAATFGHDKNASEPLLKAGLDRLSDLQDRLWAEEKHPVLVVLQGIDAAGKDGTIRHVMRAFNPQSCTVVPFGVPTAVESSHDYLWRIHQHTPARGEITIFNRSHYESVLVVRVHGLDPQAVWSRRYDQINAWERTLADEGTTVVKFFLHISADEQRDRLQERVDDPTKRWKFRLGDLEERQRWGDYRAAFEEMLERCSTDWAPWYVVPANHNWFRNLVVAEILGDVLDALAPAYPPSPDPIPPGLRIT